MPTVEPRRVNQTERNTNSAVPLPAVSDDDSDKSSYFFKVSKALSLL